MFTQGFNEGDPPPPKVCVFGIYVAFVRGMCVCSSTSACEIRLNSGRGVGVSCKCYARFTPRYVSVCVCVSEFVCVRESEYLCVYVGGGARIAVLESQVFNLQAFVHEFQFVSVLICMRVWCVCVYVYKLKAHLLMALIRSLQASVSYYIHYTHNMLWQKITGTRPQHDQKTK